MPRDVDNYAKKRQKTAKMGDFLSPIFPQRQENGVKSEDFTPNSGARDRTWTDTSVTTQDFKSCASAYSATRAYKMLSFC